MQRYFVTLQSQRKNARKQEMLCSYHVILARTMAKRVPWLWKHDVQPIPLLPFVRN